MGFASPGEWQSEETQLVLIEKQFAAKIQVHCQFHGGFVLEKKFFRRPPIGGSMVEIGAAGPST